MYASADSQKGLYPGWDSDLHYAVSLDFFKSPVVKMVPCGNLFEVGTAAYVCGAVVAVVVCGDA
jgi:hypothetical protein